MRIFSQRGENNSASTNRISRCIYRRSVRILFIAVRIFSHFGENRSVCTNLLMVNYSFTTQFYSFPSQEGANKAFLSIFESLLNKIEKESEHG